MTTSEKWQNVSKNEIFFQEIGEAERETMQYSPWTRAAGMFPSGQFNAGESANNGRSVGNGNDNDHAGLLQLYNYGNFWVDQVW